MTEVLLLFTTLVYLFLKQNKFMIFKQLLEKHLKGQTLKATLSFNEYLLELDMDDDIEEKIELSKHRVLPVDAEVHDMCWTVASHAARVSGCLHAEI